MNIPNLRDFIEQSNRRILDKQIELNRLSRENDMIRRIKELEWENHLLREKKDKPERNHLSQKQIYSFTLKEAKEAFHDSDSFLFEYHNLIFKQWLSCCSTKSEAREAYNQTSDPQRKEWAQERIQELD